MIAFELNRVAQDQIVALATGACGRKTQKIAMLVVEVFAIQSV